MIHNITITSEGTQKKIVVDGEDISRFVARAFINLDPVGLPEVHLVCTPMNLAVEADDVKIVEHVTTIPPKEDEHGLISAKVRTPDSDGKYGAVMIEDGKYFFGDMYFRDGEWGYHKPDYVGEGYHTKCVPGEFVPVDNVVYWFDLPEPPKEGEDG